MKANAKIEIQHRIPYEDLGWISVLNFVGYNPKLPPVQNSDTILQTFAPELYQKLKGNTDLTLKLAFGGAGDAASFSSSTEAAVYYYIDDVFCATGTSCSINTTNIVYVPEGSENRAAAAEDRIKAYMGKKNYDVKISELNPQSLLELAKKEFSYEDWSRYNDVKAAYLMQNGVALYADKSNTSEKYFRGVLSFDTSDEVFASLEKQGALDYVGMMGDWESAKENVQAYKAYKLSLKDKDYLYVIGTKPQSELKNPLAHWKDKKCGIMTAGKNGQVVVDAYTEVDPVSTYGIASAKSGAGGGDKPDSGNQNPAGSTGKADVSNSASAADAAKTGDDFPIGLCAVLLLLQIVNPRFTHEFTHA